MKFRKIFLSLILIVFGFYFVGNLIPVSAVERTVNIDVQAYFDEDNKVTIPTSEEYGSKFSVAPEISGYEFAFWVVNGKVKADLAINNQFIATDNLKLKAIFKPEDNDVHVYMDVNGDILNTVYLENGGTAADYKPEAMPTKPGYVVKLVSESEYPEWVDLTINGVFVHTLQYVKNSAATFTLTVEDGVGEEEVYNYNEVAYVTTVDIPAGKVFSHWSIGSIIVSYEEDYYFTMLEDTTITANFATTVEKQPLVVLKEYPDLVAGKSIFLGQYEVPAGYDVIEYGMMKGETKHQGFSLNEQTREWMMSFTKDTDEVTAYVVVRKDGVITVYSSKVASNLINTIVFGTTDTGATNVISESDFKQRWNSAANSDLQLVSATNIAKVYGESTGEKNLKFGNSTANGTKIVLTFASDISMSSIIINGKVWSSDSNVKFKVNGITHSDALTSVVSDYEFTVDGNVLTIELIGKRAFINSITIIYTKTA